MTARATARFIGATAVVAGLLVGGFALPAGAAAPVKVSAEDCETLSTLGDNIDTTGGSGIFGEQAEEVADGFDETASDIDNRKLKKALQKMADFYDELAGVDSIIEAGRITASEGRAYAKAVKVFSKASIACVKTQLTLPPDVTLPRNITIPSIPR